MSGTQTRLDWAAAPAAGAPMLEEGNRLLDLIGRQQTLPSLVAFSALHENIRFRPKAAPKDDDLLQTERFVLHEVLRLICERAQGLIGADAVLLALFEGSDLVCRAAAGPMLIPQGIHLNLGSSFLNAALESGQILRCDDAKSDVRVEHDLARQFGANSTVVVPLRGRVQRLGVVQAFSASPWAFTDQDVRSLDLFSELVLSALKPDDQDRRLYWLSNVAGEILQNAGESATVTESSNPAMSGAFHAEPMLAAIDATPAPSSNVSSSQPPDLSELTQPVLIPASIVELPEQGSRELSVPEQKLPSARLQESDSSVESPRVETSVDHPNMEQASTLGVALSPHPALPSEPPSPTEFNLVEAPSPALEVQSSVNEIPSSPTAEIATDDSSPDHSVHTYSLSDSLKAADSFEAESVPTYLTDTDSYADDLNGTDEDENPLSRVIEFPVIPVSNRPAATNNGKLRAVDRRKNQSPTRLTSHPGLAAVIGLVAVAALFSAGVWWGMQYHDRSASAKIASAPSPVTTPAAPDVTSPSASDDPLAAGNTQQNSAQPNSAPPAEDAALTPVPDAKLAELPKVTGVRHWSSSMGSTVVIDMEDPVNYEVHRLMSPERIYFDLHDTALPSSLDGKTMDVGDASLSRVRVAQPVAGVTRIVLDTKGGSNFSVSMETNPYRLVVELRDAPKFAATKRLSPESAKSANTASLAPNANTLPIPARTAKFRIVLDAGHGGWDLGTVGRQGLMEKDLVLDVTKRLGKLLESRRGADVLFTRGSDDYIALDQRADFANQAQADLFVSIHANYSDRATARGVETYYTNVFAAPGSKELEKHADGSFAQPTPISLSPAALHEKIEESRRLAASVQHSLYSTLAAKNPDIRDRGTKDASFVVLTGTTMPAILTEISFVSSPADEQNLQSESYRQQIAEALFKGISQYEDSSPRTKVAQLHPSATGR